MIKPGIIKIYSKGEEEKFFLEDGILEFKNNILSILTSSIYDLKKFDKSKVDESIKEAEKQLENSEIDDQKRFLIDQKIDVLKSISIN